MDKDDLKKLASQFAEGGQDFKSLMDGLKKKQEDDKLVQIQEAENKLKEMGEGSDPFFKGVWHSYNNGPFEKQSSFSDEEYTMYMMGRSFASGFKTALGSVADLVKNLEKMKEIQDERKENS